ncbi:glycosyltransferase [Belliella marina]|uniref:Glycosyltransferase n=1 Tax=Belliella marina TaxID=1644146 RepID=A0ABW4VQH9_9BACT
MTKLKSFKPTMILLFCLSMISLGFFVYGFISEVGVGHKVLYGLLTVSLIFKLLKVIFEWYHYVGLTDIKFREDILRDYTVDMFTTACPGEPFDMIKNTLEAMVAVTYPHKTYLCDEGDDDELKKLCKKLGVIHVTREVHNNAKAGNINNALSQSSGELCVILDPDHAPTPDFLDTVLPYFDDGELGYVQVVQAYENQEESLVAQGAAEQTYLFYGPLMTAMSKYGSAQAIGANCTFRRAALESIGGHAPGLTEDMHTSMLLHAKGWKSLYVPKIVSRGLVPSSLSAYYSQQLKWSRGTFDLWFNLVPKLFNKFTLAQKFHYTLMPVYYLFGIITLIDILVPIYSLSTGEYPWLLNPTLFFTYFIPFLILSMFFRWKAQQWLMEPHERGLHLAGGILRVGTWWIYIVGFVYTLFNHKVPYIPTPKEHSSKNEFWLGLPNLIVSVLSLAAVVYGVQRDFQPYSLLMAIFALCNSVIFFLAFLLGQSEWMSKISLALTKMKDKLFVQEILVKTGLSSRSLSFPVVIFLLCAALLFSNFKILKDSYVDFFHPVERQNVGGFYLGIYSPEYNDEYDKEWVGEIRASAERNFEIISTYLAWGDQALPRQNWDDIIENGQIPMITWEPFTNDFKEFESHPEISQNKKVFAYILSGVFDGYIDKVANELKELNGPVFLRFAHEMENPMYPWSTTGGNTAEEFKQAWKYVHQRFDQLGVHNISWVWSPWSSSLMEDYFPEGDSDAPLYYVDWVSLTSLNYSKASIDQNDIDFNKIYSPFKSKIQKMGLDLPVMLAEFGSTSYSVAAESWNINSLSLINSKYPEIKAVVLFYSNQDKNWITEWRPDERTAFLDWTFDISSLAPTLKKFGKSVKMANESLKLEENQVNGQRAYVGSIRGEFSSFRWEVDEESDFFMKGISYNPGHDWEDGFYPLSRKQLQEDFGKIQKMGANMIRRYEPSIYDRNIFKTAEEFDLKIMYGFWFDPKTDYLNDEEELKKYEEKVIKYVKKYKNNKNIIAWNIGNETYGLLKKYYSKPYLNFNRIAYVQFLEKLAVQIHQIDPIRPIFSSEEHDHFRLISTLADFAKYAPSLDVIGINSYYRENVSNLKELFASVDTLRPYAITEFGPNGYWNKGHGTYWKDTFLIEESSVTKAKWYAEQWSEYIASNKGYTLGGIAYSWRDRYEGTATWFGITDFSGRLKPSYYALASVWKNDPELGINAPDVSIVGHWYAGDPGQKSWVSAATTNDFKGKLTYEWEILNEETWKKTNAISDRLAKGRFIEVNIPKEPSKYRIYVHATDSTGNVVTASRPLLVNY